LPHTARQAHRLAIVRGVNTAEDDHGKGAYIMQTGRRQNPAERYPHFGSVAAKLLGNEDSPLPGYIHVAPRGESGFNRNDSAFLGPRYASVTLGDGQPPANLLRPATLTELADQERNELRDRLNNRFAQTRRSADTEAYTNSYAQATQVMQRATCSTSARNRQDARTLWQPGVWPALLARTPSARKRRDLRQGDALQLRHAPENFDFHIEQLGEFDKTFATLLDDLDQRGLLEKTLVIVMSEFGRTPTINRNFGRDHWSRAWSIAMAGCGVRGGACIGRTNDNGTAVTDRQVHGGHLFHTYSGRWA